MGRGVIPEERQRSPRVRFIRCGSPPPVAHLGERQPDPRSKFEQGRAIPAGSRCSCAARLRTKVRLDEDAAA